MKKGNKMQAYVGGTQVELLTNVNKRGTATVRVLSVGLLTQTSAGDVIQGFHVTHGAMKFEVIS